MRKRYLVTSVLVVLLLGLAAGAGEAQEASPVFVPMTFQAEGGELRTSACLQVGEHRYANTRWWESQEKLGPAADALRAVIAAIKAADLAALRKLSASTHTAKAAEFNQQASAYFAQVQKFDITSVPLAYELDGLYVFFVGIKGRKGANGFAPFAFAPEGGTFKFLPNRASLGTVYQLLRDWFTAPWGPGHSPTPAYCGQAEIARATHRVALGAGTRWGVLYLTGAPLDAPGPLADVAARVTAKDAALKVAAAAGLEAIAAHMTPEGARRLTRWAPSAPDAERRHYGEAIEGSQPAFVFDLTSVLVVYTRTASGTQVMYFTYGPDKGLLWTNSSRATIADAVFKRGPLVAAARSAPPFERLRVAAK